MNTEKKPYGTGKVIFLSFLACLLVLIVSTALCICVTAHRLVYYEDTASAAATVPLEQVVLPDGTSLPAFLNQHYVNSPLITDSKMGQILRDGDFNLWVGEKVGGYAQFLALQKNGEPFPEITAEEIQQLLERNDSTLQLHTGVADFAEANPQIAGAVSPDLAVWNTKAHAVLAEGLNGAAIRFAVSQIAWYVLGGILLLLLIWLIVIHVKGKRHVGTAFKSFAVPACLPGLALLVCGLFGEQFLAKSDAALYANAFAVLHETPLYVGMIGALGCLVLFGFGMIWNALAPKPKEVPGELPAYDHAEEQPPQDTPDPIFEPAPEREPVPAPESSPAPVPVPAPNPTPEEPVVIRHFCRFCGGELVNSDAKFCYKCGKAQESTETE